MLDARSRRTSEQFVLVACDARNDRQCLPRHRIDFLNHSFHSQVAQITEAPGSSCFICVYIGRRVSAERQDRVWRHFERARNLPHSQSFGQCADDRCALLVVDARAIKHTIRARRPKLYEFPSRLNAGHVWQGNCELRRHEKNGSMRGNRPPAQDLANAARGPPFGFATTARNHDIGAGQFASRLEFARPRPREMQQTAHLAECIGLLGDSNAGRHGKKLERGKRSVARGPVAGVDARSAARGPRVCPSARRMALDLDRLDLARSVRAQERAQGVAFRIVSRTLRARSRR